MHQILGDFRPFGLTRLPCKTQICIRVGILTWMYGNIILPQTKIVNLKNYC